MSRLNPLLSNTELDLQSPPQPSLLENDSSDDSTPERAVVRPVSRSRKFHNQFAAAVRWLHIYVSLLGFTSLVFFSVTGITLNHPDWFGSDAQRVNQHEGDLNRAWLRSTAVRAQNAATEAPSGTEAGASTVDSASADESQTVAKLEVVEYLRQTHHIRGAVSEFRVDEAECLILFKGPGYSADTVINRDTGHYTITETVMGLVAVINDLHKGRDSGAVWSWVIDVTALLMIFVSVTGIILIFYLKRKRWSGIITAVVGTILIAVLYMCCP